MRTLGPVLWIILALVLGTGCAADSGATNGEGTGGENADERDGGGGASNNGGNTGAAEDAGALANCATQDCDVGQRCEIVDATPICVAETCEELACGPKASCEAVPSGSGFYCVDNSCTDDLQCDGAEHCGEDGVCVADLCEPSTTRCEANNVQRCSSNGSGFETAFSCGGAASFQSVCTVEGGEAFCPCEADWDCPQHTACNAGRCEGTGKVATCTLPPSSFADAIPSPEYGTRGSHWGGSSLANVNAQAGTPFPGSTQVVMTPAVANLTDDNGDGKVNELDFPEIIFLTFCKTPSLTGGFRYSQQGILRAIHGGGPKKGEDVFAACGPSLTWHAGDATSGPDAASCPCTPDEAAVTPADLDPTAGVAVGDLDGDGAPEIVVLTETHKLRIYDRTGRMVSESAALAAADASNGSPAIANLDAKGLAEIVLGRVVASLKQVSDGKGNLTLSFDALFLGNKARGINPQGPISCLADVTSKAQGMEVVAGASIYHLPRAPDAGELAFNVASPADCAPGDVPDLADDAREAELKAYCDQKLVLVWDGAAQNPGTSARNEGFCAVADIWGANHGARPGPANPLDGKPEVILIADGRLQIFAGETGTLIHNEDADVEPITDPKNPPPPNGGGAPNVDDFDGDGFPEVGTAFASAYHMIDLQPATTSCPAWPDTWPTADLNDPLVVQSPGGNAVRTSPAVTCDSDDDCDGLGAEFACNESAGLCVCMHNGWKRQTQDDSSKVTGSSLFDFNGDGTVEVVYNDECFFRVYNGIDGEELSRQSSESRTRTENPVIADVDNDGNAEIVFGTSTESGFCKDPPGEPGKYRDEPAYRPGIQVWGDAADRWVSARRIYNQHTYHVTNVLESGGIPISEPPSWLPLNGRLYNSYRSQPRSGVGIASPNLVVERVQLSSPDGACGELAADDLTITVRVANRGDLRVGPGVVLGLYGEWANPSLNEALKAANGTDDLSVTLTTPLEPGAEVILSVAYAAAQNSRDSLPSQVRVVIDDGDTQRECIEDDNAKSVVTADAVSPLADLVAKITSDGNCDAMSFDVEIENLGAVAASGIRYTLYIGDPSAGGAPITSVNLKDPLAPGASVKHTSVVPAFPTKDVTVFVVVDPMDTIPECNDANNAESVDAKCAPPPVL